MAKKLYWRINEDIRADQVRVIGSDDKQIDVMDTSKALALARQEGLDLVEIAPKAKPPVVKIVDFGKFKYREEKKIRKSKSKTKTTDVKEIRLSPFIAAGDFQTRLDRVKEFLAEGHKVRAVVKFKGRQMGSKQFGYSVLQKIMSEVAGDVTVDMEPKFLGRHLTMVISPLSEGKKQEIKSEKSLNQKTDAKDKNAKISNQTI